ncbi:MAG: TlpA family protein disulfide reductase [Deltaproteobacteria bacterium]|nr:TlpA family protein disulfide reductase [Deltaproteobacteria bacterium]
MSAFEELRTRWNAARQRRVVRWLMDGLFLVVVLAVAGVLQTRNHLTPGVAPVGKTTTLQGEPVSFQSLRGKPTLVAIWAPWCGVCKVESQNISWAMRLAGSAANVVSIAADFESVADVKRFVDDHDADYPVWLGSRPLVEQFAVQGFPTIYFLDSEGRVKRSAVGYTSTIGLLTRLLL